MRRLLLLRHGKSAWPDGMDDLERPLTKRGREASRRMGRYLAEEQLRPDLALVSPARRTQETWNFVQTALGDVPMRSEPRIYEAPPDRLLLVVRGVDAEVGTLLMIGHNPGFEELLRLLTRLEDRAANPIGKYPTAGLGIIDIPAGDWHDLSPRSGRLDRFVTPRSLGLGKDE